MKRYGFGSDADKVVDEDVVVDPCGDIETGDAADADDDVDAVDADDVVDAVDVDDILSVDVSSTISTWMVGDIFLLTLPVDARASLGADGDATLASLGCVTSIPDLLLGGSNPRPIILNCRIKNVGHGNRLEFGVSCGSRCIFKLHNSTIGPNRSNNRNPMKPWSKDLQELKTRRSLDFIMRITKQTPGGSFDNLQQGAHWHPVCLYSKVLLQKLTGRLSPNSLHDEIG